MAAVQDSDVPRPPASTSSEPHVGPDEKADEIRLGSGTAVALISQAVALVSSVVVSALIARSLGPAGKGALSVVQQTVAIALVFGNLGISTSNLYYLSRKEITPGVATGNTLALASVMTAITAVPIIFLLFGPLAVVPDMPLRIALLAVATFAVGLILAWFGSVVVGLRGLGPQAATGIVSTAVTLMLSLILAWAGRLSVAGVLIATIAGSLAGLASMTYWGRGRIGRIRVDLRAMRRGAGHSIRAHLSGLADFTHMRQDILLLGWLSGSAAVGFYSVGVSFAELAWYIPNAVGQAIQAQAARVSHESALDFSARSLRLSILITVVVAAALVVVVPVALPLIFGSTFAPSVRIFYLLLPGTMLYGLTSLILYYQVARGIVYWKVSVAVAVLNALGNFVLVPRVGAAGAAVASSVSYATYFVAILYTMVRDTGVPLRRLLVPTPDDVRLLARVASGYFKREAS